MNKTMMIGEVTGVHGIRGELKIRPITDDPGRFYELDEIILTKGNQSKSHPIEMVRLHKGFVLCALEDIKDRNLAETFKNYEVRIPREEAVDLDEDEFFISDLIGLAVADPAGRPIGKVKDVLTTTGSVDTIEIKTDSKTIYVPFRKEFFAEINFENNLITADIPDDYFEL